jgi:hypothetical protein
MNKRETFEILKQIQLYFDQFVVNQERVNLWHEVLRGESFEEVEGKLQIFVKDSSYPPKIADLIHKSAHSKMIPNLFETKKIIKSKHVPASETVIQRELEKMRTILGIVRG